MHDSRKEGIAFKKNVDSIFAKMKTMKPNASKSKIFVNILMNEYRMAGAVIEIF